MPNFSIILTRSILQSLMSIVLYIYIYKSMILCLFFIFIKCIVYLLPSYLILAQGLPIGCDIETHKDPITGYMEIDMAKDNKKPNK